MRTRCLADAGFFDGELYAVERYCRVEEERPADSFFSINETVVEAQVVEEVVDNPDEASDAVNELIARLSNLRAGGEIYYTDAELNNSGIVVGKKYGENAVASIISRSFAEITTVVWIGKILFVFKFLCLDDFQRKAKLFRQRDGFLELASRQAGRIGHDRQRLVS